jgi:hypothetical protein
MAEQDRRRKRPRRLFALPKMQPVESGSIAAVGYDAEAQGLFLTYRENQETYVYLDVPPEVVAELVLAESKGQFVNREIKGHYAFEKLS